MKFKRITNFMISFLLLTSILITGSIKVNAATASRVYYSVDNSSIKVGQTFNIYVNCENISDLYGASVDFKYDSSLLQITGITEGKVFNDSNIPHNTVVTTTIPNNTGIVSIGISLKGNVAGFNGTGNLFVIQAKALKTGTVYLKNTSDSSQLVNNGSNICVKLANATSNEKISGVAFQGLIFNINTATTVVNPLSVSYQSHIQDIGWQSLAKNGDISGSEGTALRVEALKINLKNPPSGLNIKYKTHVQTIGWQNWVYNGALSGTEGKGLRVEAIQLMLEGTDADKYKIEYQSHVQNEGWQSWVSDGQSSGSLGKSQRIEAIRIRIVTKASVSYQSHVQSIGWQSLVKNGALAGTEGKGLRVEALKIKLENVPSGLKIKYRTHVQSIGWQGWVYDGALAGTEGKSLRIEAIQIMLEGTDAAKYKIEYQSHVQDEGWQSWVSDGQLSGTTLKSRRIEAIRINIVKK